MSTPSSSSTCLPPGLPADFPLPKIRVVPKLRVIKKKIEESTEPCPQLQTEGGCYYWPLKTYVIGNPIYTFDLDGTLIQTRSGAKFATDSKDWKFQWKEVPIKLKQLLSQDAYILIITNQKGISSGKTQVSDIRHKVFDIIKSLGIGLAERFGLYIAGHSDGYRKPWSGIWDLLPQEQLDNVKWYCGDAAGRKKERDFHATDRYFAENKGIPFHTPEEIFLGAAPPASDNYVLYPAAPYMNSAPETYRKQLVDLLGYLEKRPKTMIIMVGGPGSGKSTLAETTQNMLCNAIHIERDMLGGNQKKFLKTIQTAIEAGTMDYVIADATHPNKASRAQLYNLAGAAAWHILILYLEVPIELAQHQDAVRVQLGYRDKPIPLVAHRTFHKRFREDEEIRKSEQEAGLWYVFTAKDPTFTSLPEYQMKFI